MVPFEKAWCRYSDDVKSKVPIVRLSETCDRITQNRSLLTLGARTNLCSRVYPNFTTKAQLSIAIIYLIFGVANVWSLAYLQQKRARRKPECQEAILLAQALNKARLSNYTHLTAVAVAKFSRFWIITLCCTLILISDPLFRAPVRSTQTLDLAISISKQMRTHQQ